MAYTTIDDPSEYFNTVIWSGDGNNDRDITGVGFKPDWVWIKERTSPSFISHHALFDSNRGGQKMLSSSTTNSESTTTTQLQSFITDGFNVNDSGAVNGSGETYVAWNWKVNGGTTSSNTDGSITSTVQANTTAGFSIVTWTGSGTSNETVGHGLTTAPEVVILKPRSEARHWLIWFEELGDNDKAFLFNTDAPADNRFGPNAPTSSVFGLYGNQGNRDGTTFVAYAFHSVQGYSKIGKYTGNGNADGPFVYTGFKPAFTLIKRTDASQAWVLHDSARAGGINPTDNYSYANATNVEAEDIDHDYLSNGFKIRATFNDTNASGGTYVYIAFAEHPFVSSKGVPVTAK
tara:strand:+ start:770 stop:1810 length:1041 start_codon:yes stop_codon:yes gene_type:complete